MSATLRDRGARKLAMLALGLCAVLGTGALTMAGLGEGVAEATQQAVVVLALGALGANVGEHLTRDRGSLPS
jgi:hypothetical protein